MASNGYEQYCPLSLAAELLCQRWTILVISRVIDGCHRFNAIHRGVPRMSPTLLSKRLTELETAGILSVTESAVDGHREYSLTAAGHELAPLIDAMAVWGQRWARDNTIDDLDPAFLVWSMHLRLDLNAFPEGQTVIAFDLSGAPRGEGRFWLVVEDASAEMCLTDPGLGHDVLVECDIRTFVEAWRGFRNLKAEIQSGRIAVSGPPELRRQLPDWLRLSGLATVPRMRRGRERRLARRGRERQAG